MLIFLLFFFSKFFHVFKISLQPGGITLNLLPWQTMTFACVGERLCLMNTKIVILSQPVRCYFKDQVLTVDVMSL